ncbi:hypothetical protein [Scytonema sp. PCC 10023]|uniref:hypothetical protein n=1 Tax=Scytonema sp. PCC 10023 TaxID=1680591 RepID=UPI0039C72D45
MFKLRSCTQQEPEALISRYQVEPGNEGLDGDAMSLLQLLQDLSLNLLSDVEL